MIFVHRSQKLENVSIALEFLEREGITLVNIDSTDIVDCKLKLILGLIWTLILHYAISMPMWEGPPLGGEKEPKTPKQRLMDWVKDKVPGCNNFTTDWNDGKKIGELVDTVAPGLCPDWEEFDPNKPLGKIFFRNYKMFLQHLYFFKIEFKGTERWLNIKKDFLSRYTDASISLPQACFYT